MKKTFKVFALSIVLITIFQTIQAQKTTFSVYGGANFSKIYSSSGGAGTFGSVGGFNFGFQAQVHTFGSFYLQPGISVITKGSKYPSGVRVKSVYTNIPVNLTFITPVADGNFLAGAGVYFGIGSGGSVTNTSGRNLKLYYKSNISDSEKATGNIYLKRMDIGLNTVLGYEFHNKLSLVFNAQFTMFNMAPKVGGKTPANKLYYVEPAIVVGYRF